MIFPSIFENNILYLESDSLRDGYFRDRTTWRATTNEGRYLPTEKKLTHTHTSGDYFFWRRFYEGNLAFSSVEMKRNEHTQRHTQK